MYQISSPTGHRHLIEGDMPGNEAAAQMWRGNSLPTAKCGRQIRPVNFYDPDDTSCHQRYLCAGCFTDVAPADNGLLAYRILATYGVTARRASCILLAAQARGRVDGNRECGEDPYTVTWTPDDGYTITEPQPEKAGTT